MRPDRLKKEWASPSKGPIARAGTLHDRDDVPDDDDDKATCDVCGGLPTRRCFDCPYDHRSCDDCGCDEWQRLCDKGKDKESDDEDEPIPLKRIEEIELDRKAQTLIDLIIKN